MSGSGSWSEGGRIPLGTKGQKNNPYAFLPVSTGNSSMKYGRVNIDPSIRALQDKGLGRIDEQYAQAGAYGNELIGNTRGLRSRFLGNQSDYANAQLNPLREQIASGRGELQRSNSMRGLSGSSFGNQSLTGYDSTTGRDLRDATANVEMQQLQALTGIDAQMTQQMFGQIALQAQLNGETLQVSKDRLQQELSALGLGLTQIKQMSDAFEAYQNRLLEAGPYQTSHAGAVSGSGMGGGGSG